MNEAMNAAPKAMRKVVYAVTEKGDKSYWTRVGLAFDNRDGSTTCRLDAVPVNGILQIREEEFTSNRRQAGGAQ